MLEYWLDVRLKLEDRILLDNYIVVWILHILKMLQTLLPIPLLTSLIRTSKTVSSKLLLNSPRLGSHSTDIQYLNHSLGITPA